MKKLLLGLVVALNINVIEATNPYVTQNEVSEINIDQAGCGSCDKSGCNGGNLENPLSQQNERNALASEKFETTQTGCGSCDKSGCNNGEIINPFSK